MSAFIPVLRGSLLYLSRQKRLRQWMENSEQAQRLTSRFIAGLHLEDALRVAERLQKAGMQASLDYLGENVTSLSDAGEAREQYLEALKRAAPLQLGSTVSMKVTSLGLDISLETCMENTAALVQKAAQTGTRVEFDMEDSNYTDRNLRIVHTMQDRYPGHVRAVIQAYLHRSEADIEELCRRGIPVRLCKGAYLEPESIAWQDEAQVDKSYSNLMRVLFDRGVHPALATHDEVLIREAVAYAASKFIRPEQFEFQMLYGVRRPLQEQLVREGFRVRLYVPYGSAWYPYFMRRLAERPANLTLILRNVFSE